MINPLGTDGNGGEIYIHVNGDTPALHTFFPSINGDQLGLFDTFLGNLMAGDTIYIGIGPNGSHGSDDFSWDFDIVRFAELQTVPEPSSWAAWMIVAMSGLATIACSQRKGRFLAKSKQPPLP